MMFGHNSGFNDWPFEDKGNYNEELGNSNLVSTISFKDEIYYIKTPRFIARAYAFSCKNPRDPSFRQLNVEETDIVEKANILKEAYEELIQYVDLFNSTQNPAIKLSVCPTYFLIMRHANDYATTMVQKESKGKSPDELPEAWFDEEDTIRSVLLNFGTFCNIQMRRTVLDNPTALTKYILELDSRNKSDYAGERAILVRPDIHGANVTFNEEANSLEIFDW